MSPHSKKNCELYLQTSKQRTTDTLKTKEKSVWKFFYHTSYLVILCLINSSIVVILVVKQGNTVNQKHDSFHSTHIYTTFSLKIIKL